MGDDDPLRGRFAAAGLDYNRPAVVPNTKRALRLVELARERGLHARLHERLLDAYWAEATDIGDPNVLRRLAGEAGLDQAEVDAVLADDAAYLDVVEGSTRQAHSLGISGIPAFLLDRRLIVMGAQPLDVFRRAFAELAT